MEATPIRVLLVDDSPLALAMFKRMLAPSPDIEVVGTARNGKEALAAIPRLQPAVICTDLRMPVMDGLELTREVMATFPRPVLVVSAYVQREDARAVFDVLAAGATDVFPKPSGGSEAEWQEQADELVRKIKILSRVVVLRKRRAGPARSAPPRLEPATGGRQPRVQIVAVGASTGGPQALCSLLSPLPDTFPVPIICVQHMSAGFLSGLAEWLGSHTALSVKMAEPNEVPNPGTVYMAQEGAHLVVSATGRIAASHDPPVDGHRPSVTQAFQSVASRFGAGAVGVLLSGMGRDGADGMRAIAVAGGTTFVQDKPSCVVFGMPQAAIRLDAAQHILPPDEMAAMLITTVYGRDRSGLP